MYLQTVDKLFFEFRIMQNRVFIKPKGTVISVPYLRYYLECTDFAICQLRCIFSSLGVKCNYA